MDTNETIMDEAKRVSRSQPTKTPDTSRKPHNVNHATNSVNTVAKTKHSMARSATDEAFSYNYPAPEKAKPAPAVQPAIGDPTVEDPKLDAMNGAMLTNETTSGMALPTASYEDKDRGLKTEEPSQIASGDAKIQVEAAEIDMNQFDNRFDPSFNFSRIENLIFNITSEHPVEDAYNARETMANALTELFNGVKCEHVLYTPNTDNLFFGIRVYPTTSDSDMIYQVCATSAKVIEHSGIHRYDIEFDSKLFNPITSLSEREITALALYAIYHTVVDDRAKIDLANGIRDYEISTYNSIDIMTGTGGVIDLLGYAIKDALMKQGSPFNKRTCLEVASDPFITAIGYHGDIERGLNKLARHEGYMNADSDRRNIILSWVLRVIDDYPHMRFHAYNQVKKCIGLTGSQLENRMLRDIANTLSTVDSMHLNEEAMYEETAEEESNQRIEARDSTLSPIAMRKQVVDLKVDLSVMQTLPELDAILTTAWNNIKTIQAFLNNPYLSQQQRDEWDAILMDFMAIKQACIENKDYLDRQAEPRIPIEYLSLNESF